MPCVEYGQKFIILCQESLKIKALNPLLVLNSVVCTWNHKIELRHERGEMPAEMIWGCQRLKQPNLQLIKHLKPGRRVLQVKMYQQRPTKTEKHYQAKV